MEIIDQFLTPNPYSRPQTKIKQVKAIILHWTANTGNVGNFTYFENRKYGKTGYGSAQFLIYQNGKTFRFMPENEVAYHAGANTYKQYAKEKLHNAPNNYSLGIELCPIDANTGAFSKETIQSAIELCVYLCKKYNLNPLTDIGTHSMCTGKECPRYYVRNPQAFEQFKRDVANAMSPSVAPQFQVGKLKISLFDEIRVVEAINKDGYNFVKIRDLESLQIKVAFIGGKVLINNQTVNPSDMINFNNTNYLPLQRLNFLGFHVEYDAVNKIPVITVR